MLYGVYGMSICLVTVNVFFFSFSIIWNLHLFYRHKDSTYTKAESEFCTKRESEREI